MLEALHGLPLLVKALILGIVEGLTEFLPISSTGHLILASDLLGFTGDKAKLFAVAIQTGAMLSVIWLFRAKIGAVLAGLMRGDAAAVRFALNIVIAFIPAALLGFLFNKMIKAALFKPVPVALAFIVGALVILWVEFSRKRNPVAARIQSVDDMSALDALKVGLAQAFALIPGTSRSGATIIGGMLFGLSRQAATEFSFFLAIPTLIAAGLYDSYKDRALLSAADLPLFAVGLVTSFIAALICVRWLIRYVAGNSFVPFAWYRIVFGLLVLATAYTGAVSWVQ